MFYYDKHTKKVISTEMLPCFCFGFAECNAEHQTLCCPFTSSKRLLMTFGCHMST